MQQGSIVRVRSDKDTDFTGAIAQNAQESENLVPPAALGAGGPCRSRLHSISIISKENLDWELWFFSTDDFATNNAADIDQVGFLGKWAFIAADATRIAATGAYFYYIDGLDIAYHCTDFDEHATLVAGAKRPQGQVHVMLINRSAAGKSAGANGELVIQLGFEPTEGR